jgi:1-acyl-sn-glycerol-3-phosphate acyltransferase
MRLVFGTLVRILHRPVPIGRENMPTTGPCFIISNHSGMYDSFILNYLVKGEVFAGIMTDEFLRKGFLPFLFKQLGTVATRKFQPQTTPVRDLIRLVQDNRMIVLMPEGESNWDGATLPTVASTGKLFRAMKVPVYPVTIHNGYLAFPRWANWPRAVKIFVEFRPPLHFTKEMTNDQVAEMVDAAIRYDPLTADIRITPKRVFSYKPARMITRLIFRCPNCGDADGLDEIRGKHLVCYKCGEKWRVHGDSTLTNTRTRERRSATELFRQICLMPRPILDFGAQGKGLIRTPDILVSRETEYPHQQPLGRFDGILREDRIDLLSRGTQATITIPLDELRSLSNELKKKCQLRTDDEMYQITFKQGSSLHWQIYIKDILPHLDESLVRPTDFATGHSPV